MQVISVSMHDPNPAEMTFAKKTNQDEIDPILRIFGPGPLRILDMRKEKSPISEHFI